MMNFKKYHIGFEIDHVTTCDFKTLIPVTNDDILHKARDGHCDERLIQFIAKKMGIETRYHAPDNMDSLDLASQALRALIEKDPTIVDEAEFFILAGISNPYPTTCTSALLAGDYHFKNASCWDIKSGCSTGVLGLLQALDWFNLGAKRGVLVCTETLSKFSDPRALQMSAATGDGACALSIRASENWNILGTIHGTDSRYLKSLYVKGRYPIELKTYNPQDYYFSLGAKADALEMMAHHWQESLAQLLKTSGVCGKDIQHYIAHQVDGNKNKLFAQNNGILEECRANNFAVFGNMGCPTIFINYKQWIERSNHHFKIGDKMIFHATGGGISWAGLCMEKRN